MSLASTQALTHDYDYLMKVLLIGDSGVGKSCLLLKYTDDYFCERFISTIGVDFKIKTITIPGCDKIAKLQLWDTAGQERFRTIVSAYYRGSQAIVLCFDCTNRASFEHIKSWLAEVDRYAQPAVVKVLVALKSDLTNHRVVGYEEAKEFADALQIKYVEASSKTGAGVQEVFRVCAKGVYDSQMLAPRAPKTPLSKPLDLSAATTRKVSVNCCPII